jgi:hypothetical protein
MFKIRRQRPTESNRPTLEPCAFLSESRMRENRLSGSMSGEWKRGTARLLRHRQTKGPATDRPSLNYRATPRLYSNIVITYGGLRATQVSIDGALVCSSRDYSPLVVRRRPCLIESFLSIGAIEKTHWTPGRRSAYNPVRMIPTDIGDKGTAPPSRELSASLPDLAPAISAEADRRPARACYGRPRAAARRWPPGIPGREGYLYSGWQQYLIIRRTSNE